MRENNGDHTKTTLQRTLEKSHDFDVKAVFLRANQMTKANFATLIQACIVLVVVFVIIGAITQPYITVHDDGSCLRTRPGASRRQTLAQTRPSAASTTRWT